MPEELCLRSIVPLNKWQNIQDHFSEVLGITMVTLDKDGRFITKVSRPATLCREILATSVGAVTKCRKWWYDSVRQTKGSWRDSVVCPFGLRSFFIPLSIAERIIAYLFVGPLIIGKYAYEKEYKEEVKNLGINEDEFLCALKEIKTLTFYGARSMVDFLYDISSYIIQLEFQNLRLKRAAPDFLNMLEKVYGFYMDKLLGALLDVAFSVTGAHRASLMLFDEGTNELYIKKAKGISQEVIENTRLGLGEGIAGIVAKERRPLLLDENILDARLKERMHKPNIKTSLSMPIEIDKKLLGVLNIATLKPHRSKISKRSMETIHNFVKLIESAIKDLPRDSLQ